MIITQKDWEYANELREWINTHPTATYKEYLKARDELRAKYTEA